MQISIACIGPEDLVRQAEVESVGEADVRLVAVPYSSEIETADKVLGIQAQVDAILFTGPVPYCIAQQAGVLERPVTYVSLGGAGLYVVLAQILLEGGDPSQSSIDTLEKATVNELYREIGIRMKSRVKEYAPGMSSQEIVAFHEDSYRSGRSRVAITCLRSVQDALIATSVPVYRVVPTSQSVRDALRTAFLEGLSHKLGHSQIAICVLDIECKSGRTARLLSSYEIEASRSAIYQSLLRRARVSGISIVHSGDGHLTLVATRSTIEEITRGFTAAPFADEFAQAPECTIRIGIGVSKNAYEAEVNARAALHRAQETGGESQAFAVFENEGIIGPLTCRKREELSSLLGDDASHTARQLGLKLGTVIRLQRFAAELGDTPFSPAQLAPYLSVSQRSARRLLEKLRSKSIAELVGKDASCNRGRPHNLYTLRIDLLTCAPSAAPSCAKSLPEGQPKAAQRPRRGGNDEDAP